MSDIIAYVFVTKKIDTNMCPFLKGYGVMKAWHWEWKLKITENVWNKTINIIW